VFVPLSDGVHIADVLGQAQDIPNLLSEYATIFQSEIAQFALSPSRRDAKGRKDD
jgi:hypothetical protein